MKILWKNFLLDLLFPQFCIKCQKEGFSVCPDCLSLIDINPYQYCPFCSFPNRVIEKGKCQSHKELKLNGLFSAVSYQNPLVKKMIALFKYKPYIKTLCAHLAFLIISHFALLEKQEIFTPSAILMPVPIAPKKEKERGYNQSAVVAKILSLYYKVPLQTKNLIKIKNTPNQVGLKKEKRWGNIAGSFSVRWPELIKAKTIFLVDDVFTTGATMEECAKVLKLAGAKKVWGIAICREGLTM
ncbi:MAG: ComF family protein [Candidatus Pacebacteria bacterium]|nr:ComF family protein [Candidatus Paceibacterota bacterium]